MFGTPEESYQTPSSLILPALNVLRAIQLNEQGHDCMYQYKINPAINDLETLLEMMK
jgi:hypothetical protein